MHKRAIGAGRRFSRMAELFTKKLLSLSGDIGRNRLEQTRSKLRAKGSTTIALVESND